MAEREDDKQKESAPDSGGDSGAGSAAATKSKPARKRKHKTEPKKLPPYNVVQLDDDDHTYAYVIEMLGKVFSYPAERGYQLAKVVDTAGRVIVLTTHKELAELKRDQILGYGADPRMDTSKGSMRAVIEPAEG